MTEVDAVAPGAIFAGQTIYVPAYSSVSIADRGVRYDLAITLYIRNTHSRGPIVVTAVRYHDHDGRLVRDYLSKPLQLAPLAAMEYFVKASDTSGGFAPSFIVEWVARQPASAPVVEAVMVGTAGTQGISFTCPGRVIADRASATPRAPKANRAPRAGVFEMQRQRLGHRPPGVACGSFRPMDLINSSTT